MYCTINDIINELSYKISAQLSNDADPNTLNDTLIEQYISDASELINSYLRGRYPLPLQSDHAIIKNICIDVVKYELYKRRSKLDENLKDIYNNAISDLNKLQRGIIVLDEGTTDTRPKHFAINTKTQMFTQELLDRI